MALLPYRQIGQEDPEYGALAVNEYQDPDTGEVFPFEAGTEPFDPSTLQPPQQQAPDPMQGALASNTGPSNGGEQQVYSASDPRSEWGSAVVESEKAVSDAGGGMGEYNNDGGNIRLRPRQDPEPWYGTGGDQQRQGLEIPAPPMRYSAPQAAGWQQQSRKLRASPEAYSTSRAYIDRAGKDERQAAQTLAERDATEQQRAWEQAVMQQETIKQRQQQEAYQLAKQQQYVEGKTDQFRRHRDMIRNQPITPTVYEGDTGRTILAVLSTALGAFGSALSGGPNQAAQMLQRANEQHVNEQMRLLEGGLKGVDEKERDMWEQMRREGNSPEQIREQMIVLANERTKAAMGAMAAEDKFARIAPELQQASAMMDRRDAEALAKLEKDMGIEAQEKWSPGRAGGYSQDWNALEKQLDIGLKLKKLQGTGEGDKALQQQASKYQADLKSTGVLDAEAAHADVGTMLDTMKREGVTQFLLPENRNVLSRMGRGIRDFVAGEGSAAESDTPEERKLNRQFAAVRDGMLKAASGATVTPQEQERLMQRMLAARTIDDLYEIHGEMGSMIENRKRATAAAYDPQAIRAREERRKLYNQRYEQAQPPVPTPKPH